MDEALRAIRESDERLHTEKIVVRFQEVDAAGVVFYARIFDYFHDAYVGFLRVRGAPLEEAMRDRSWIAPLRHARAEYLRPLRFGDELAVSLVSLYVEETEFTIGYRIEVAGRTTCVGLTRHVAVDPETFRRAAIPGILRRALDG